jgi:hypothetical protein
MRILLRGVVRGPSDWIGTPGLGENRVVDVGLRTKQLPGPPLGWKPGSTETAAGMLADTWTPEDDRILEEIYEDRKRSSFGEIAE